MWCNAVQCSAVASPPPIQLPAEAVSNESESRFCRPLPVQIDLVFVNRAAWESVVCAKRKHLPHRIRALHLGGDLLRPLPIIQTRQVSRRVRKHTLLCGSPVCRVSSLLSSSSCRHPRAQDTVPLMPSAVPSYGFPSSVLCCTCKSPRPIFLIRSTLRGTSRRESLTCGPESVSRRLEARPRRDMAEVHRRLPLHEPSVVLLSTRNPAAARVSPDSGSSEKKQTDTCQVVTAVRNVSVPDIPKGSPLLAGTHQLQPPPFTCISVGQQSLFGLLQGLSQPHSC